MTLPTQMHSEQRGLRGLAARHPVAAFHLLLFGIGYPLMALPILAHRGVIPGGSLPGMIGLDTERLSALLMVVVVMLPSALWVTWAADGRDGLRALLGRAARWRFGWRWWLVVLLGLPSLSIAFALLLGDTLRDVDPVAVFTGELAGLLIGFLLINLWEETAWAGVVQTRLERRHSLLVAALLTGIPFALIHMPFQFIDAFSLQSVMGGFIGLLIFGSLVRLLLGAFLRGAKDSLFAVGLLHTMFNRSNNTDGIVAQLLEGDGRGLAALIATLVLTVAVLVVNRKRLGRAVRRELDARAAEDARSADGVGGIEWGAEDDRLPAG